MWQRSKSPPLWLFGVLRSLLWLSLHLALLPVKLRLLRQRSILKLGVSLWGIQLPNSRAPFSNQLCSLCKCLFRVGHWDKTLTLFLTYSFIHSSCMHAYIHSWILLSTSCILESLLVSEDGEVNKSGLFQLKGTYHPDTSHFGNSRITVDSSSPLTPTLQSNIKSYQFCLWNVHHSHLYFSIPATALLV